MNVPASCGSLGNIGPVQMEALQPGIHSIQVPVKNSPVCTGTHPYSQGIQLIHFDPSITNVRVQRDPIELSGATKNFITLHGVLFAGGSQFVLIMLGILVS